MSKMLSVGVLALLVAASSATPARATWWVNSPYRSSYYYPGSYYSSYYPSSYYSSYYYPSSYYSSYYYPSSYYSSYYYPSSYYSSYYYPSSYYSSYYYPSSYYSSYYYPSSYYSSYYYPSSYYSSYYPSSYYSSYYPSSYYSSYYYPRSSFSSYYYPSSYYSSYYYPTYSYPTYYYTSAAPAYYYVQQPIAACPAPAVQPVPIAGAYAQPQSAPPSQSKEPPIEKKMNKVPTGSDTRSFYFSDGIQSGLTGDSAGMDSCQVGFWNTSGRDVTLTVNGASYTVPRNRNLTLTLGRTFSWQVDGRSAEAERVANDKNSHEIVIR